MSPSVIGLLSPGEMGAAIARCLRSSGHDVLWASEHRSAETRLRAEQAGLTDAGTVAALAERAQLILSIAPPHAAGDVAESVAGRTPLLVDANAVSPTTADTIASTISLAGGVFVDGGIIGPPPAEPGTTRLYLSGERAAEVAALFSAGPLDARVVSGSASALKMCYAAWTKGTSALLLTILAAARNLGVDGDLAAEWALSQADVVRSAPGAGASARRKGWRWVGEMREIADTFGAAGLPRGFHEAAAEVYARIPRDAPSDQLRNQPRDVIAELADTAESTPAEGSSTS